MSDFFKLNTTPFLVPDEEGYSVSWDADWKGYRVLIPHGEFFYAESFFNKKWSDRAVEYFQENAEYDWRGIDWREISPDRLENVHFSNIKWKQDYIKLYGKSIPLPRLTSWYGDAGKSYKYSGIRSDPNPWTDGLLHIKDRVEAVSDSYFNCVLLNWYRDGQDSLNWHADDEKELGRNPVIASANFGATRDFLIRNNEDHSQKISIPLKHGTLLLMRGEMQHYWQHSIPKRPGVQEDRFNLTFRTII